MEVVPLATVLARPDVWRGGHFADAALPAMASGFAGLDHELPGGGWPRGALTELLCDGAGQGEMTLLLPALKQLCAEDGWLVLIAPPYPLHAGALAAAGIPLERLLIVETGNNKRAYLDALWTAEQALSSDAASAVLCWSMQAENKAVRRLQLAAATSHAASFLVRPTRAGTQASAAPLRLALKARHGGLDVNILKRRGPPLAMPLHLVLPRPAKWRSHQHSVPSSYATHGNALARPLPSATVTRHPSSPAFR
ncbi:MAG TPA: translesion DNA synthesis-associated protein ImuA [Rhodocyclaceae bacterium]|nr:translesion DNA synthesis-associated protein ImuA [Rhodocyclaceae bacterium]